MTSSGNRAAIYARCRSLNLEEYELTLEQQLDICYAYCANRSYEIIKQYVCFDLGEGDPMFAPQLGRIRQGAEEGQIDVLVVATADRIHDLPAWQVVIIMGLEKLNVRVEGALERNGTNLILEQIIRDTDEAVATIMQERAAGSQGNKTRRKKGRRRR